MEVSIDNKMKKDLVAQAGISTNAIANRGKARGVYNGSTEIYETLKCQIEDIVEIEHTRADSNS